jgi:phi LC3 family holin
MLDLQARLKNKAFVVSLVSAILLALGIILKPLGITIPNDYVMNSLNAVLSVLTLMGIIVDPSTPGIYDSTTTTAAASSTDATTQT